ncbi:MAG: Ig-like domain-containing protein, partial [bacterium]|nr:Ig-like domain-containing protein [bacterium]
HWYGNYDLMVRVKINDDMDGPYASGRDPADGATGVPVDSDIVFHIEDDDIGVDVSTINTDSVLVDMDVPVKGKIEVTGSITIDDTDPNDVIVTFDPDYDFEEGAWVTVTVSPSGNEILDDLGNVMAEDSWEFFVFMAGVDSASLGEIKAAFK